MDDTLTNALILMKQDVEKSINKTLPCVVTYVNEDSTFVNVQPLIKAVMQNGEAFSRAQIRNVPVHQFGGGGFVIHIPILVGDKGWIESSDRDISLFLKTLEESIPNSARMHSFSDGRFIPDLMRDYTVNEENKADLTIQNKAGNIFIKIGNDGVTINGAKIDENGNITATSISADSVLVNGKELADHKHEAGAYIGNTGAPITGISGGNI